LEVSPFILAIKTPIESDELSTVLAVFGVVSEGLLYVLQQIPLVMIGVRPLSVISPPLVAVVAIILLAGVVAVSVGIPFVWKVRSIP